jgi:hypothetical protein
MKNSAAAGANRRYPDKDLKLLFGLAAGRCSFCHHEVLVAATEVDDAAIIGKIAHIEAHSDKGPRANSALTTKQRDSYANWILLCGNHHDLVDQQPNTFTVQDLRKRKGEHEAWVRERLTVEISSVAFAEFETLTVALNVVAAQSSAASTDVLSVREKMKRNQLSVAVEDYLKIALSKAGEVREFLSSVEKLNAGFGDRLALGIRNRYDDLKGRGYSGDELFEGLLFDLTKGNSSLRQQAAGLAVLGYLFQICEVFEK